MFASIGCSGGLALLWDKGTNVCIQSYSKNHIDATVQLNNQTDMWRFTGFYGEPDTSKRKRTWNLLKRLVEVSYRDWVCMGDFNEVLLSHEKRGGGIMPEWRMRDFREALSDAGLIDIGYTGYDYTWCNNHEFPSTIEERLDRVVVNSGWHALYPAAQVQHLSTRNFDHLPLLLLLDGPRSQSHRPKKQFLF